MTCCVAARNHVTEFFVGPKDPKKKSKVVSFCKSFAGRDKTAKVLVGYTGLAKTIAETAGASQATVRGLDNTYQFFKVSRTAMALMNIFGGVISNLYAMVKKIIVLSKALFGGNQEALEEARTLEKHNLETRQEMRWALAANIGGTMRTTCYIGNFGVIRPAAVYGKYIDPTCTSATSFATAGAPIMAVNHVGSLVEATAGWKLQHLQKERMVLGKSLVRRQEIQDAYKKSVRVNKITLVEKGAAGIKDIATLAIPGAIHPIALGALTALIATASFTKVWLKTT